ncbi:hypothetical protein TgHK011_010113 [Trichoderma gracile]|nr:hypothetical protein TgHK011_010113 [Trichoderma gracile]
MPSFASTLAASRGNFEGCLQWLLRLAELSGWSIRPNSALSVSHTSMDGSSGLAQGCTTYGFISYEDALIIQGKSRTASSC